jgi:spore coat polysaccharide biosynthesis predicted glycosyltransferase SpsG
LPQFAACWEDDVKRRSHFRVLFRAAAGSKQGYGHLMRCGALATALEVERDLSLRGSPAAAHVARGLGWKIGARASATSRLAACPDLLVIDDPSADQATPWVRQARRQRIPVATVHDPGIGRFSSDLRIDGNIVWGDGSVPADLQGPEFAILDPIIPEIRSRRPPREPQRVLITLGGGQHVRAIGARLAERIATIVPGASIDVVAGLGGKAPSTPLPARCRWVVAPSGLAQLLATASVAVVAGGITLYEACALGTPVVTLAVTPAQRPTTTAVAAAGVSIDASAPTRTMAINRAAADVAYLLANPERAARLGWCGSRLVDGQGAARVARHLLALVAARAPEHRHVA